MHSFPQILEFYKFVLSKIFPVILHVEYGVYIIKYDSSDEES